MTIYSPTSFLTDIYLLRVGFANLAPKNLKKIQERALRFIYNDYSSTHHEMACEVWHAKYSKL